MAIEFYQCDECYKRSLSRVGVHINFRLEYDSAFGQYSRAPYMHCCACTKALGGQTCEHDGSLWS